LNKPLNVSVEGTEGQEATKNAMEKTLMDAGPQMLEQVSWGRASKWELKVFSLLSGIVQLVCSRVIFILEEVLATIVLVVPFGLFTRCFST
jgi:hypothetical protein